jgi:quercetin dioxygenase-like cupin family protein
VSEFVHVQLADSPPHDLVPGVSMRPLFGARGMINLIEFEVGAEVPAHSHPHEQLGYVVSGVQILIVDGIEHPVRAGEGYVIPGGVEHAARCGPDGAVAIDVFVPVREDYRERVEGR